MKFFLIHGVVLALFLIPCLAHEDIRDQMDPTSEHNKAHLKEDLTGIIDKNPEDMDVNELQFHYFRQHDYDGDEKLDGNEIVASILHHEQTEMHDQPGQHARKFTDEQLSAIIDDVLKFQDRNGDGKLDFKEYTTPYNPEVEQRQQV